MSDESPATRPSRADATTSDGNTDADDTARGAGARQADTPERTDESESADRAPGRNRTDPSEGGWVDRSGPAARPSEVAPTGEPSEPDPTDLGPDPPSVSIPEPGDGDVPPDLARVFWTLVVVLNAAILAVTLGALLVGFEGRWRVGGGLLALGIVLFARAAQRYRRYTADEAEA